MGIQWGQVPTIAVGVIAGLFVAGILAKMLGAV